MSVLYFLAAKPRSAGKIAFFLSGILLLLVTLASPLQVLAREYVLSGEVIVHVLISLVVPLLLIAGLPRGAQDSPGQGPAYVPIVCWSLGMVTISIWYVPVLYNQGLRNGAIWNLMLATIVAAGFAFWWPLFQPRRRERIKPVPAGIWYLLSAMIWCSFTGMVLAFTVPGRYQPYIRSADSLGILSTLQTQWQMTRSGDQETAGLLFWVGTMAILLNAVMLLFYRWYRSPEMRNEFEKRRESHV